MPHLPCFIALLLALLLQACASPAERLLRRAGELGYTRQTVAAAGFDVETFANPRFAAPQALHVYLEGDGLPWASFHRASPDPTPRQPLMLEMMRLDPAPAVYLGRPCYHGHAQDLGCSPLWWTQRRYAPEIVAAMALALAALLHAHPHDGLVFLGHSGGGALALLLARRFPETRAVVTFAGNADIDLWANLHGYSPLQGSLNPADSRGGGFAEIHYLGADDKTIPPDKFVPVLAKRHGAEVRVVEGFSHVCCWESILPEILPRLP
ncbi:MAG: alpha/beta hydrolase [Candidatus Methylumidiphilus sp.]